MTTATAEKLVTKPAARAESAGSVVSLTLDPETYTWFEAKALEDDRTISKFIARHLRSFVQAERKKKEADEKF